MRTSRLVQLCSVFSEQERILQQTAFGSDLQHRFLFVLQQTAFGFELQYWLTRVSNLQVHLAEFGLASTHNHVSQVHTINLFTFN